MKIEIQSRPSFAMADVHLDAGESVISEGGAMVSMSSHVTVETSTFSKGGGGGLLKAAKRLLAGESLFLNKFTAPQEGHVSLAPTLMGDIEHLTLDGAKNIIVQGSSFLAGSTSLDMDTQFAGMKGFFSGESVFWIKMSGSGDLLLNSFGGIFSVEVDGKYVVDTGHIVAYEDSLEFKPRRVGGWKSTILSGEGLVCEFNGKGKLWMQTHNAPGFGQFIGAKLPPRER